MNYFGKSANFNIDGNEVEGAIIKTKLAKQSTRFAATMHEQVKALDGPYLPGSITWLLAKISQSSILSEEIL